MSDPKKNCWEVKECGREPGGKNILEFGACPVPLETRVDGINGGKNGGRACWAVAGTFCDGKVQGTLAKKIGDCLECDFFKDVMKEEGGEYAFAKEILIRISDISKE